MLLLKKLIAKKFDEIPQVSEQKQFFDVGIDKAKFPTVIVNFPNVADLQNRQDVNVEVNIWYNNDADSIIEAEELADTIDNKFRKVSCVIDNSIVSIDRQNIFKQSLPDEDDEISRIQLKYTAKVYLPI